MTEPLERDSIYERLRDLITRAEPALGATARDVVWASPGRQLGFARAHDGRIELFLVGSAVFSVRPRIARHLEHDSWEIVEGGKLVATRLLLPNEPHFDQVAAFICTELTLDGVDDDVTSSFRRCEGIIDLALADAAVGADAILGLCGEMLLLDALIRVAPTSASHLLLNAWAGHSPSSRDLQWGPVGVEVKTTTRGASEHHVQGPHQVELGLSVDGVQETSLFLLSIGLVWLPLHGSDGFRLPALISGLAEHLSGDDRGNFLERVGAYAGTSGINYDPAKAELPPELRRPFNTSFVRLYDMTDERITLPNSALLASMDVVPESVNYRIRLPVEVNGTLNPTNGLSSAVARVLASLD